MVVRLGGVAGLILAMGLLTWAFLRPGPPFSVVELPAAGVMAPALLEDGTPVFVRHGVGEEPLVVEALAPETGVGVAVAELVAWCPTGERFVAAHDGRSYAPTGERYLGANPGRLAPDADVPPANLVRRPGTIGEGQDDRGDPMRVGEPLPLVVASELPRPANLGPTRGLGPPPSCRLPLNYLQAPPAEPGPRASRPLDHRRLAAPMDPGATDGWQVVDATLVIDPSGETRWESRRGLPLALGLDESDTGGSWAELSGPLALRMSEGAVIGVAVMFTTSWRGSSLRGGFTYTATVEEVELAQSRLVVSGDYEGDSRCINSQGIQYLDQDTEFDPEGLEGTEVEITVDAVTCRALRISPAEDLSSAEDRGRGR